MKKGLPIYYVSEFLKALNSLNSVFYFLIKMQNHFFLKYNVQANISQSEWEKNKYTSSALDYKFEACEKKVLLDRN
jgi:hypothetical protein